MHDFSAHTAFATGYDRRNMHNLAGDVHDRAHLFSHWDTVLLYRRLEAAAAVAQ